MEIYIKNIKGVGNRSKKICHKVISIFYCSFYKDDHESALMAQLDELRTAVGKLQVQAFVRNDKLLPSPFFHFLVTNFPRAILSF